MMPFGSMPLAMAVFDVQGRLAHATGRFCYLMDCPEGSLHGMSIDQIFYWRGTWPTLSGTSVNDGISKPGVVMTRGGELPVDACLLPVDFLGEPHSLLTVQDPRPDRDVERILRAVIDVAPTATLLSDGSGEIVLSNAAAGALFGYDPSELIGMSVDDLVDPECRAKHAYNRKVFGENRLPRPMGSGQSITARRKDGSNFPVEIALYPLDRSYGDLIHATVTDLTERHATEALSDQKTRRMEALNSDLSAFAYSASHDLKAPLSSISGLLSICIEDLDEGNLQELRENLDNAVEISRRSAHKVEAVLAIARVGQETIPAERFDPNREIHDIWRDLTGAMTAPPDFRVDLDVPDLIRTERPTFNLVLENLLSNALRYGDDRKDRHRIRVSGALRDDRICLIVADNGLGIPPENLQRIFKMFDRIDDRSGDGMGLSLVRKQIERLNGSISVSSTPGAGTEFSFSLPLLTKGET
ncbi:MAG: hypothetical protein CML02_21985 [Pseudooceanicola sp.]|nr:hypothetical protein [Pseudooceanicola sp.]